ncbi:MAG: GNAT family N-acetyltransferase [Gemmatimonadetes bacterium]|nr:GNAT family N-acetyltransferase [Gemmatimonadota bacterium]
MDHRSPLDGVAVRAVSPSSMAVQWCLEKYFEELDKRLPEGLDRDRDALADHTEFSGAGCLFLVASVDGHWVGCGGLKRRTSASAYIKRMWVDEAWRGKGLGRRLLTLLEDQAKDLGYSVVKLETNRLLHEAIQLYRTQGYQGVTPFVEEPCADYWFEKSLDPGLPK